MPRLAPLDPRFTGLWPRWQLLRRSWWQLRWRWRPQLVEDILKQLASRQAEFTALGLAALEVQLAAAAGARPTAVQAILDANRGGPSTVGRRSTRSVFSSSK